MPTKYQLSSGAPADAALDLLAVCVTDAPWQKQAAFKALDAALSGALTRHVKEVEYEAKPERTLDIPTLGRLKAARLVLVGVGDGKTLDSTRARTAAAAAMRYALGVGARNVGFVPPADPSDLRCIGEGLELGAYRFSKYFTGERRPKREIGKITVFATGGAKEKRALDQGVAIGQAVAVARDAVNEPPNELYPEVLAQLARDIAKKSSLKIKVLDKAGIARAGMKLHYAVGQGSSHDPRFIHMSYTPPKRAKKRVVFVGKGLTFDSGGLCIKPAPGMGEMKSDMGGAGAVLGLMAALGVVKPNVEVHGIIGAAENMPDGAAYRPGDVFGSLDGKTVEIINTDAEGRLVLADALAYATKLEPDVIVDAATLTGACIVALGKSCSAYYATNDDLSDRLATAAREAGESFWRMPLLEDLREQLKSDIADLKHTGDRWGGSITAALFLREFVGDTPWIHCDVAGPVLADRASGTYPKGATGHPVLTFLRFVERLAG